MQEKQKVVSVIADPIPEEVRKHIEATAKTMIGHGNLTEDDFQDICQEISMEVVKAAPNYNPEKCSYYTFAQAVVKQFRSRIFRYRMRHGMDVPAISLDEKVKSDESGDITVFDVYCNQLSESEERREEVLAEVRKIVSTLSEKQRQICILIMDGYDLYEILEKLNISRPTYYRYFAQIQTKFKKNPFFSKNSETK